MAWPHLVAFLGGTHIVSLAKNSSIVYHLEEPAYGSLYRLKSEDIICVQCQRAPWPNQECRACPLSQKVVEAQELSKVSKEFLGDPDCFRWKLVFLEVIRNEGSVGM